MATASFASSVGLEFKVAQTAKVPRENPINQGQYQTRSRHEKGVVALDRSFPLALNRVKSKASASVCLGHESNKCVSHGEREKLGNESEKGRESAKARKEGLALGGGRNRRRFLTPIERARETCFSNHRIRIAIPRSASTLPSHASALSLSRPRLRRLPLNVLSRIIISPLPLVRSKGCVIWPSRNLAIIS